MNLELKKLYEQNCSIVRQPSHLNVCLHGDADFEIIFSLFCDVKSLATEHVENRIVIDMSELAETRFTQEQLSQMREEIASEKNENLEFVLIPPKHDMESFMKIFVTIPLYNVLVLSDIRHALFYL